MMPCGVAEIKLGLPKYQFADINRMKSIHIFGGIDGEDDTFIGNMFRQGELNQDAVDIQIFIQIFYHRK